MQPVVQGPLRRVDREGFPGRGGGQDDARCGLRGCGGDIGRGHQPAGECGEAERAVVEQGAAECFHAANRDLERTWRDRLRRAAAARDSAADLVRQMAARPTNSRPWFTGPSKPGGAGLGRRERRHVADKGHGSKARLGIRVGMWAKGCDGIPLPAAVSATPPAGVPTRGPSRAWPRWRACRSWRRGRVDPVRPRLSANRPGR